MVQAAIRKEEPFAGSAASEINDYAIIGDCRTAALVSRAGSIDWLCLPHFSGPSVFAALLDQKRGGRFTIQATQGFYSTRRYLPGTAVLETTFYTATGMARVTDMMPIVHQERAPRPMREILRIVEGIEGEVTLDVRFEPRPDYARARANVRSRGPHGWACAWGDELFWLASEARLELASDEAAVIGQIRIRVGERFCFSLAYAKGDIGIIAPLGAHAWERLHATVKWWRDWTGRCA